MTIEDKEYDKISINTNIVEIVPAIRLSSIGYNSKISIILFQFQAYG